MSKKSKLVNLLIVSEHPENIDFIEKSLKKHLPLNTYIGNSESSIKDIFENETIDLAITDSEASSYPASSLNQLHQQDNAIPIIRIAPLQPTSTPLSSQDVDLLAPSDANALAACCKTLLKSTENQQTINDNTTLLDSYKQRFTNLYEGITDPICYLHDGVFVDCNPAFLRHFEISDKSELDELTILSFVDKKAFTDFSSLLRKATRIDLSANPATFPMFTHQGKPLDFTVMCKPAQIGDEKVVQVYMRSPQNSEGGTNLLFDETTGLANRHQMGHYLQGQMQQAGSAKDAGTLMYLFIKNYRDVWGSDGRNEAEKFIQTTVQHVRKAMPARTELSRYTDDGLVMHVPEKSPQQLEDLLESLIKQLDKVTPHGMKRMVEPVCYIGYEALNSGTDYEEIISQTFRSARNAAMTNATVRIHEVASVTVSKKDNKRVEMIKELIAEKQFIQQYQPIAGFSPDGIHRYHVRLAIQETEESLELSTLVNTAERYQLMHEIDQWQIQHLFNELLSLDSEQRQALRIYVPISSDSLKSAHFTTWLTEQLEHTGLPAQQFVFELTVDNVHNAYTGALAFNNAIKSAGGKVAIIGLSSLTEVSERVINDMTPDVLKVDIREIDTLDDNETDEVMNQLTDRAKQLDALIVAEHIESPAQLSKIWPYDIKFIQGDGMTPVLDTFDFAFDDFAI